ncbi:MAG TPA: BON domain-containing protein [Pirellulaceae bacterium]|nr:BON domain-containing protein [Pirellulaceae bacterium]
MSSSCAEIDQAPSIPPASVAMLEREFLSSPYWSLRQLRCDCRDGHLVVSGTVTTFYLKQLVVAMAVKIAGVGCVRIEVNVRPQ